MVPKTKVIGIWTKVTRVTSIGTTITKETRSGTKVMMNWAKVISATKLIRSGTNVAKVIKSEYLAECLCVRIYVC